jgi:hypothetical protein
MQWHHARIIAGAARSLCSEHPLLSQIEKLIPDNQVICQSGKPHAFIRVAHAFLVQTPGASLFSRERRDRRP